MREPDRTRTPWLWLVLLAGVTIAVEGYHFGTDDAEVYLAAVKRAADPGLYPFGAHFFLAQTHWSAFAPVVGGSARLLHLPASVAVLFWYVATLVLLLGAAWRLARLFFESERAGWGAVALVAALLEAPVAGTALVGADNYLTARSFSTPLAMLAAEAALRRRPWQALAWLAGTAAFHPLMAVYAAVFCGLVWWFGRPRRAVGLAAFAMPWRLDGFSLQPAQGVYREVLYSRTYFFAQLWQPYEWIGVVAPLLVLGWIARGVRTGPMRVAARALVTLGVLSTVMFLLVSASPRLESFARLQPMRSFQLLYLLLFVMLGGWLAERWLKASAWRWVLIFLPLALGMFALDGAAYPASEHLELPGVGSANPWLQAFAWIRVNTPRDAVFAMEPNLMAIAGEDRHGFRGLAERSSLADHYKDSGPVTMFPALAPEWEREQALQRGFASFGPAEFAGLAAASPVRWVVVELPQDRGLSCPYRNRLVAVCRIEP